MNIKASIEELLKSYIDDAHGDGYDTVELPIEDARNVLSTIKSLAAERDKYREALEAISRGLFSTRNAQTIAQSTLKGEPEA